MSKSPLTITVSGPTKSGKTTLAALIDCALSAHGLKTQWNDPEDIRLDVLRSIFTGRRSPSKILKGRSVVIQQVVTPSAK